MDITYRDNILLRNRLLLKMALGWAIAMSLVALVLAGFTIYALKHRTIHWLPLCSNTEFSLNDSDFSPTYLQEIAKKVIDLRLTYHPETVEYQFNTLLHLVPANHQDAFKKILDKEKETVRNKNISSVFYLENLAVDVSHREAKIKGTLHRTSHGLSVKAQKKSYLLVFSFSNGKLWAHAIQEITNENT